MKDKKSAEEPAKNLAILNAAVRLFLRRGPSAITMDDIASEAGVAKGTLFLYYPSKDALFAATHGHIMDMLYESLGRIYPSALKGEQLLRAFVGVLLEHFERRRDLGSFSSGALELNTKTDEFLAPRFKRNLEFSAEILKTCAESGAIVLSDPLYHASALFGLCRSSIVFSKKTGITLTQEERISRILDIYLNGARKK
ncbi:MAG: TetR/AcrR family transcriptional regulator [Elusimicrobiaceae bacterium]